MNRKFRFLSNSALAAMLLLSMVMVLPATYASPGTKVYIDPVESVFYTNVTHVGDKFKVKVNVTDVTDLFGYEFKIMWDNTTLKAVSAVRPSGHFLEPQIDPANYYVAKWLKEDVNATHAHWWLGYTLLAPETGRTGGGVLVELEFEIRKEPPWKGEISSLIYFEESILGNSQAQNIPHDRVHGVFRYIWAPPTVYPYLSVDPALTTITAGPPVVGTTEAFFDVYVKINNVSANWWLIGAEFKLAYNSTLIDFVSIDIDPWVDAFGDIYLVPVVEGVRGDGLAYIHTAVILLPHDYPPSEWWWPISGSGRLVKVRFEVVHQEEFPWVGESPLDLYDVLFGDIEASEVPKAPEVDGRVRIEGYIVGRMIDVYTQYDKPYGGQGPNKPSDAFAPQNEVILSAQVTYNLDPVQNKKVDFEVKWPDGTVLLTRQAFTNTEGIATINFRIPWPDTVQPKNVFGNWSVTATCDLADVVINDTLTFEVNWLMEVVEIKTAEEFTKLKDPQNPQLKGQMWFKVTWEVRSAQVRQAVITVVVYDDLDVPIAWGYYPGNFSATDIFVPQTYSYNFTLPIPTWAYVGPAKVYANIYTTFPQNGGASYGPEKSADFRIVRP